VGQAISEVLPFAIGVAISPVPIVAVILMLFSSRARVNGPMFLLGWVGGLAIATGVLYALAVGGNVGSDSRSSDAASWLRIVLGVLLLLAAVRNWKNRPEPGSTPQLPKWMAHVDALSPGKALGLGALLSSVNPKNLMLAVGTAAGLAELDVSTLGAVVGIVVFVTLASVTIAGPVVWYLVGGEKADKGLAELKDWLAMNNAAVMAVLLLVFGVLLISKGVGGLSD